MQQDENTTKPILLLLPGFENSCKSTYIRRVIGQLRKNHHIRDLSLRIVVLNFRGYSGLELSSPKYHNVADSSDLHFVVQTLKFRYPHAPIIAAGFSMGSNTLIKYLGEQGSTAPFLCSLSLSNPYDLVGISTAHDGRLPFFKYFFDLYQTGALYKLKQKVWKNRHLFEGVKGVKMDYVMKAKSLPEFSDRFSALLYGYKSSKEYYEDASCCNYIHRVASPLLCVSASDDPIVPHHIIPIEKCRNNRNILLVITKTGGHLGWVELDGSSWLPRVIVEYVQAQLELHYKRK